MRHRLAALVNQHLTARHWRLIDLQARMVKAAQPWVDDPYDYRVGLSLAKMGNLASDEQAIPGLLTLAVLAKALEIPLTEVIEACGVEVD